MATSGTFSFNPTADEILTESWERLGKNAAELTGDVARAARRSLMALFIDWTNKGINLWQIDQQSLTTQVGVASYVLPLATVEPLDMNITLGGVERDLPPIGRSDYRSIPNKATRGPPNMAWHERGRDQVTTYLYPTPDAAYTISYSRLRQPQDVLALGQHVDVPVLWIEAVYAGLAAKLAEKFAPEREAAMVQKAGAAVSAAAGENRQRTPLKIGIRLSR